MNSDPSKGRFGESVKGKIAVLIEEHFDQTEFNRFNEFFPQNGYQVEYISHLWNQPELHFGANPGFVRSILSMVFKTHVNPREANIDGRGKCCRLVLNLGSHLA